MRSRSTRTSKFYSTREQTCVLCRGAVPHPAGHGVASWSSAGAAAAGAGLRGAAAVAPAAPASSRAVVCPSVCVCGPRAGAHVRHAGAGDSGAEAQEQLPATAHGHRRSGSAAARGRPAARASALAMAPTDRLPSPRPTPEPPCGVRRRHIDRERVRGCCSAGAPNAGRQTVAARRLPLCLRLACLSAPGASAAATSASRVLTSEHGACLGASRWRYPTTCKAGLQVAPTDMQLPLRFAKLLTA